MNVLRGLRGAAAQALLVTAALFLLVGVLAPFLSVETTDEPIVQCGWPAVRVWVAPDDDVRGDCQSEAGYQVFGGLMCLGLGGGAAVGWWRLRRRGGVVPVGSSSGPQGTAPPVGLFPLQPVAGVQGAVLVYSDRIVVEHPFLLRSIDVPAVRLAAVTRPDAPDDLRLRRRIGRVELPGRTGPDLALVFDSPKLVGPFSDEGVVALGLVDDDVRVDVVLLAVEDVGTLIQRLRAIGVRYVHSEAEVLEEVIGVADPAPPPAVPVPPAELAGRRVRRAVAAAGALLTVALSIPIAVLGGHGPGGAIGLALAATASGALVTLVALRAWPHHAAVAAPAVAPEAAWHAIVLSLAFLALAGIPGLLAGWLSTEVGVPWLLTYALAAGVPGGLVVGAGWRIVGATGSAWW